MEGQDQLLFKKPYEYPSLKVSFHLKNEIMFELPAEAFPALPFLVGWVTFTSDWTACDAPDTFLGFLFVKFLSYFFLTEKCSMWRIAKRPEIRRQILV